MYSMELHLHAEILPPCDSIIDFDLTSFVDNHIQNKNLLSIVLNKEDQRNTQQRMKFLQNDVILVNLIFNL